MYWHWKERVPPKVFWDEGIVGCGSLVACCLEGDLFGTWKLRRSGSVFDSTWRSCLLYGCTLCF